MPEESLNEAVGVPEPACPPRADQVQRTLWPIVFGAVGVIYAAWVLYGDVRYLAGMAQKHETFLAGAAQPAPVADNVTNTNLAIGGILSIWLLWASIGLIRRKPGPARSLRNWAITKLICLASLGTVTLVGALQVFRHMHAPQAGTAAAFAVGYTLALLLVLLLSAALPIFAVIWLSRRRIRSEIATWG